MAAPCLLEQWIEAGSCALTHIYVLINNISYGLVDLLNIRRDESVIIFLFFVFLFCFVRLCLFCFVCLLEK